LQLGWNRKIIFLLFREKLIDRRVTARFMAEEQHYPVQRRFDLKLDTTNKNLIHADQILSQDNHRLYRQGRVYSVKIDLQPLAEGAETDLKVYALADTWYIRKAWQEAKMQFDMATHDEKVRIGSNNLARWRDFRVHIEDVTVNTVQHIIYDAAQNSTNQVNGDGEYTYPSLEGNDGDASRVFSFGGATDATQFGMIKEYSDLGNTNRSPSNPTDGGYKNIYRIF
jgi:hypothetical protein